MVDPLEVADLAGCDRRLGGQERHQRQLEQLADTAPTVVAASDGELDVLDAAQGVHQWRGYRLDRAAHEGAGAADALVVKALADAARAEQPAVVTARGDLHPRAERNDEIGEAMLVTVRAVAVLAVRGVSGHIG